MKTIYLLDRLTSKHIAVDLPGEEDFAVGEKIIYFHMQDGKKYVGLNVGYEVETDKQGKFEGVLTGGLLTQFEDHQKKALEYFKLFKKQFTSEFAGAIAITARGDLYSNIVYFYFYSEERYNFAEFVKNFRQQIPCQFFIYQVGARDMMRLSPHAKEYLAACGCGPLGCCSLGKLPSVEMDNISLQSLEGRDVEKLKGRCGKLKCSVVYERALYLEETEKFPKKGEVVKEKDGTIVGQCIGHNIMTGEMTLRTNSGEIIRRGV